MPRQQSERIIHNFGCQFPNGPCDPACRDLDALDNATRRTREIAQAAAESQVPHMQDYRERAFPSAQWRRRVRFNVGPWTIDSKVVGRGRVISVFRSGGVARLWISLRPFKVRTAQDILSDMAGRKSA